MLIHLEVCKVAYSMLLSLHDKLVANGVIIHRRLQFAFYMFKFP